MKVTGFDVADKNASLSRRARPDLRSAVRRLTRRDVPALTLMVTMAFGLVLTPVAALLDDIRNDNGADRPLSAMSGDLAGRFDDSLEELHPLRTPALRLITLLRYQLFRQGSGEVVVGREGWLYTEEELRWDERDLQRVEHRLDWVVDAVRLTDERARIVVLLLPSKARVRPEPLSRSAQSLAAHPRYEHALAAFRDRGIPVVDGRPALEGDRFFRRDTHWRPEGAVAAAEAVGELVAVSFPSRFVDALATDEYTLRWDQPTNLAGDLMNFVPLGPLASNIGLGPETYRPLRVEALGGEALGLFDTPDIPVTLVGTSFSADPRWGFEDALRFVLSADVLNVAEAAAGPFVPMASYLSSDTIREIPPQLLIWEIPERYLTLPEVELPALPIDLPGAKERAIHAMEATRSRGGA
ncbi:MAG: hypothetical protein MI724_19260 [Spirochaetales bacterium]|nr:hypothetical protein [Spirochaetales bacterium]